MSSLDKLDTQSEAEAPESASGFPMIPGSWLVRWEEKVQSSSANVDPELLRIAVCESAAESVPPIDGEDGRFYDAQELRDDLERQLEGVPNAEKALRILDMHIGPGGKGFPMTQPDVDRLHALSEAADVLERIETRGQSGYVTDDDVSQFKQQTERMAGADEVHQAVDRVLWRKKGDVELAPGVYGIAPLTEEVMEVCQNGTYGVTADPATASDMLDLFMHSNYEPSDDEEKARQKQLDEFLGTNNQPPKRPR